MWHCLWYKHQSRQEELIKKYRSTHRELQNKLDVLSDSNVLATAAKSAAGTMTAVQIRQTQTQSWLRSRAEGLNSAVCHMQLKATRECKELIDLSRIGPTDSCYCEANYPAQKVGGI